MHYHRKRASTYIDRIIPFGLRRAIEHRYRWVKRFGLSVGVAMVAISLLPIPLGNASPKSSQVTLDVPLSDVQSDGYWHETAFHQLALPAHLGESASVNEAVPDSDRETDRESERQTALHTATVRKGDSLSTILDRLELPQSVLHSILDAGDDAKRLGHLRPGQTLNFEIGDDRTVKKITHRLDETSLLEIALDSGGAGYRAEIISEEPERRTTFAMGTIRQNLFLAGQRAGLSDRIIMELVGIFAWDIDFALNVRSGDRFALIYEQLYREGEKIRDGKILAAEFVNRKRVFRAVRYRDGGDVAAYYTPDGRNMKKAFLRTPVEFTRISSRFQLRRLHPVLNKIRAHRGVDYAAPRGTPIKVTANGKVTFVGKKGGLGKAIFVRHGKKYTTVYGHLHRYAKGIKKGKSVRQGQLIGYVGSTGLATGPHLHYEFRVNGVHKDPLTVELPKAAPIDSRYLSDFKKKTGNFIAQLGVLSRTVLALGRVDRGG